MIRILLGQWTTVIPLDESLGYPFTSILYYVVYLKSQDSPNDIIEYVC